MEAVHRGGMWRGVCRGGTWRGYTEEYAEGCAEGVCGGVHGGLPLATIDLVGDNMGI